jgi:hypothetical protein
MRRGYYSVYSPYAKYLISEYMNLIHDYPYSKEDILRRIKNRRGDAVPFDAEYIDGRTKITLLVDPITGEFIFKTYVYRSYHKHEKRIYENGKAVRSFIKKKTPEWNKRILMKLGWLV